MNKQLIVLSFLLAPILVFSAELQLTPAQLVNVNLSTITVDSREGLTSLNLNGMLVADQRKTHRVAPVVEGIVMTLDVVAHETVSKGQILARLHSQSLGQAQADYLEALARYELARSERTRIEGLWKDGVVAESRWLSVDSEYKIADATLAARRRLLSLTGLTDKQVEQLAVQPNQFAVFDLTSPIDGLVTDVEIESGQLLSAGQPAFHIVDLSSLWAMVKIPVASLEKVNIGGNAEISVQGSSGQLYHGKLESLGGEVDATSQTLDGRIVLDNPEGKLLPGMYAKIKLSGIASQGLMVPAGAVFQVGEQNYIFKVLAEDRFEPVAVVTGIEASGWIPIISGIGANETIVSSGVAELKSHWQYQGGE